MQVLELTTELYIKKVFKETREFAKIDFYYRHFCKPEQEYVKDNKFFITLHLTNGTEEQVLITDSNASQPVFVYNTTLKLEAGEFPLITDKIETTVGRFIVNYLMFTNILNGRENELNKLLEENGSEQRVKYFNKMSGLKPFESVYNDLFKNNLITIREFTKFVDTCSFLQDLSRLFVAVCSARNITPPDGLDEYKKKVSLEYDKKYGKDWRKNVTLIASYTEELKKLDKEYLKDDPATGKLLIPKVTDNSRVKCNIAFGMDRGMDPNAPFVEASLTDGYPQSREELAAIFNSIIAGSYFRGKETVNGGVLAKVLLRAGLACTIKDGDCGTTKFLKVTITPENANSYRDRNFMGPNGVQKLTDPSLYFGKTVNIRTPMYCKLKGKSYCASCVSEALATRKFGIPLLLTDIGGVILNASMKAMHDTTIHEINVTVNDMIK